MPESKERTLPRPAWSGTISFGLVSIPVSLYPATRTEHFAQRTLSPEGTPLRREYYCPDDGETVPQEELVRGYEVAEGEFVTVTDEELENLAPDKSRDIDLRRFAPQAQLSPAYFERAHFMVPASDTNKAYRLLAETLERTARVGVATFVMRGKEYLVAILAEGGVLRAATMRFSNQLRTPADIGLPAVDAKPDAATVQRILKLLKKQEHKRFDAEALEDRGLKRAHELVQRKLKARKDVVEAPQAEEVGEASRVEIIDLIAALKQRLAANDAGSSGATEPRAKKGSARPRQQRTPGDAPKAGDELKNLSKERLYEEAQMLKIEGRSAMTKPELVKAVARARQTARRAS